jgi:hypothetical protein
MKLAQVNTAKRNELFITPSFSEIPREPVDRETTVSPE